MKFPDLSRENGRSGALSEKTDPAPVLLNGMRVVFERGGQTFITDLLVQ